MNLSHSCSIACVLTPSLAQGLTVVNNVALFGYSNWGTAQSRLVEHSSLAAFDLLSRRLLWIKEVATHGLLNTVSVPHIAIDSTYRAVYVGYGDAELPIRISKNFPDSPFLLPMPQTAPLLSPIAPHHRTSEETCKNRHREVYHATRERGYDVARLDSNAFYRLPVQVDFKRLDEEISAVRPAKLIIVLFGGHGFLFEDWTLLLLCAAPLVQSVVFSQVEAAVPF